MKISDDEYYDIMCNFKSLTDFKDIHDKWFSCFHYILTRWGFNKRSIKSLFDNFVMLNWKDLHQENTEFKDLSKELLYNSFAGECWYISDRMSYDRLFRTHWLFLRAFHDELNKLKYPTLYK